MGLIWYQKADGVDNRPLLATTMLFHQHAGQSKEGRTSLTQTMTCQQHPMPCTLCRTLLPTTNAVLKRTHTHTLLILCLHDRDFISWGYKPHLEVLDKLLSCLRLQLPKSPPRPPADLHQRNLQLQAQLQPLPHPDAPGNEALGTGGSAAAGSAAVGQQQGMASSAEQQQQRVAMLRGQAREASAQNAEDRPYEVPFDKRALDAVGDAISMGLLPAIKVS